jgi:hypothetical protein
MNYKIDVKPGDTVTVTGAADNDEQLIDSAKRVLSKHHEISILLEECRAFICSHGHDITTKRGRYLVARIKAILGAESKPARCLSNLRGFEPEVVLLCEHSAGHEGMHKATFPNSTNTWSWDK